MPLRPLSAQVSGPQKMQACPIQELHLGNREQQFGKEDQDTRQAELQMKGAYRMQVDATPPAAAAVGQLHTDRQQGCRV